MSKPDKPQPLRAVPGIIGFTRGPTRREWRRAAITFVIGMVALFLVVFFVHPQPTLLEVGSTAPPIVLNTDKGVRDDVLGSAQHRPVVVEFFESTCATCQQQQATLCHAEETLGGPRLVEIDAAGETAEDEQLYAERYVPSGCSVTFLVDPGLTISRRYEVAVVPTVYVVDGNGKIAYGAVGASGIQGVDSALRRLTAG